METKNDKTYDQIEIRSEKVRNIIGTIPSTLVYWSIAIIVIIVIVFFVIGFFVIGFLVPYPYGGGEVIFQHLFFSQK